MGDFTELKVWQKSKDLAVKIYRVTQDDGFARDFRFRDQLRAAAVSVPSNIAEGDELGTNKQSIRHFYIAKGSVAEIITQLVIASEIGYLSDDSLNKFRSEYQYVSHMLAKLIKARSMNDHKTIKP